MNGRTPLLGKAYMMFLSIHPYINTANTIAVSVLHPRLDYCNFLFWGLPDCQLTHLQHVNNNNDNNNNNNNNDDNE